MAAIGALIHTREASATLRHVTQPRGYATIQGQSDGGVAKVPPQQSIHWIAAASGLIACEAALHKLFDDNQDSLDAFVGHVTDLRFIPVKFN